MVYACEEGEAWGARKTVFFAAAMAAAFLLPLLPWAARNLVTLKKAQFIAPRYANLPGEYAPVGFYAWTSTWLERYRDVYFTVWKIGEADQPLIVDELPSAAFDSPEEKMRVAELFAEYNTSPDLEISPELDVQICRTRARENAPPPFAHLCFCPVAARPDNLVHAAHRAAAHRRKILARPRAVGRFSRRCPGHRRICCFGLSVCRAGGWRSLGRLACQWREHRNGCGYSARAKSLGNRPPARIFSGSDGVSDDRGGPGTSLRRLVLSGSARTYFHARGSESA